MHWRAGHGTTGEHFEEGKRKLQHQFITKPKRIEEFLVKDTRNKITDRIQAKDLFIVSVSAGRNHILCLESSTLNRQTTSSASGATSGRGRVFSWGFGGYGRLGHNGTQDELMPRLITSFDSMCNGGNFDKPMFADNAIIQICAGRCLVLHIVLRINLHVHRQSSICCCYEIRSSPADGYSEQHLLERVQYVSEGGVCSDGLQDSVCLAGCELYLRSQ